MIYASLGKRLSATLIDVLILLPLLLVNMFIYSQTKNLALFFIVFSPMLNLTYTIILHAYCGQTLGKRAVGIRVVKFSGERIFWTEAFLRSSVNILFITLVTVGWFIVLLHFPESDYNQLPWRERSRHISELKPSWLFWIGTFSSIWSWGDPVIIFFNQKRRALHDFIAGTVVIEEQNARVKNIKSAKT